MMLVLLTAEFTILLLFTMTYIQLYANYKFVKNSLNLIFITPLFLAFLCNDLENFFFVYSSYYKAINHLVSSDFFILYYFLFEKSPLIIILLTLIISFFSLFFIFLYFNLKFTKNSENRGLKSLFYLRKQNLFKQTRFINKLYTFQY